MNIWIVRELIKTYWNEEKKTFIVDDERFAVIDINKFLSSISEFYHITHDERCYHIKQDDHAGFKVCFVQPRKLRSDEPKRQFIDTAPDISCLLNMLRLLEKNTGPRL